MRFTNMLTNYQQEEDRDILSDIQPDILGYFALDGRRPEFAPKKLSDTPVGKKYAEVFHNDTIVIQMERDALTEKIMGLLDETEVKYRAVATKEIVRLFFRGELKVPYFNGYLLCGAKVEMISSHGYLEHLEGTIQTLHVDEDYSMLPYWLLPTENVSPLFSTTTLIGESEWIAYLKPVFDLLRSYDTVENQRAYQITLDTAKLLNKNFRWYPFDEKRMVAALDIMEFTMPNFYSKEKEDGKTKIRFQRDKFAEWFIKRYRLINLEFLPYRYSAGIYIYTTQDEVEMLLMRYLKDSSITARKELANTIFSLIGVYGQKTTSAADMYYDVKHPARPELIAFNNGIYNITTGEMMAFNENIIVTNRVNIDYEDYSHLIKDGKQTEAMKIVDDWLDSFAESDKTKRLVLEEVAGLSMYHRNSGMRRQHTILVGKKESGKSTFIRMVEHLIGEENCSHVSLESICNTNDRFSLITLVGKALNTSADISSRTILDCARLKNLCTADPINVEQKNQPVISLAYRGKLLFGANALPRIQDSAVSSRFEFISCNADYSSRGSINIPDLFENQLSTEECMKYFAYLAVQGLKRFVDNNYKHTYCEENEELRHNYEKVSNPVEAFVNSISEDEIVEHDTGEVYEKYLDYICRVLKLPESECEPSKNTLTTSLKRLGFDVKRKSVDGKKMRVYTK